MTLLEKLTADYKESMKNKEETRKLILNYVLAQIKQKKIDMQQELSDDDIIALIRKEIKALCETISFLEKGNNQEELAIETEKKNILEQYLPQMLSREETWALLEKMIQELWITDLKTQRGLLMKELMANHKSELDWAVVNDIINSRL